MLFIAILSNENTWSAHVKFYKYIAIDGYILGQVQYKRNLNINDHTGTMISLWGDNESISLFPHTAQPVNFLLIIVSFCHI